MPGGLHPPLSVMMTWKPNYVNPETRGQAIVPTIIVLLVIAYIVVALRLWARFRIGKNAGPDDALIIFNMLPLTGLVVGLCLGMDKYEISRHVWDVEPGVGITIRKIAMALEILYMVSTVTTKISILLFYRRLVPDTVSRGFRWAVYATIAFVVAYFVTFFLLTLLRYQPIYADWMLGDPFWWAAHKDEVHHIDEGIMIATSAIISAVQDFLVCGMPMVVFWKMDIPKRQRLALGALFAVGFFLCICSIMRVIAVFDVYWGTYDVTWAAQAAWMWLTIEAELAVICASAPALKQFFAHTASSFGYGKSWGSTSSGPSFKSGTPQMRELNAYDDGGQGEKQEQQVLSSSQV